MDSPTRGFDSGALGSDRARSRKQYWARRLAGAVVSALRLNRPGLVATEICQTIRPVATVRTAHGTFRCRAGHGRLVWRADTFKSEEPDTVRWLDRLTPNDVLWDVGANVGMYSLYAAKLRGCRVVSFEPEAQNYALLVDNIALNDIGDRCLPGNLALTDKSTIGRLRVRYITKGGAFNAFSESLDEVDLSALPDSFQAAQKYAAHGGFDQLMFGFSADDLVMKHALPEPTFMKVDVDGLEPRIIDGARELLKRGRLKSLLIELNTRSAADMAVPELLKGHGYELSQTSSNWDRRADKSRAEDLPAVNMIFDRAQD